jgi:hypothetical protein
MSGFDRTNTPAALKGLAAACVHATFGGICECRLPGHTMLGSSTWLPKSANFETSQMTLLVQVCFTPCAVLCLPAATCQVSFMWDVAQALGKALDAAGAARKADAARGGSAEVLAGLAASIAELRKAAAPVAALPEGKAGGEGWQVVFVELQVAHSLYCRHLCSSHLHAVAK